MPAYRTNEFDTTKKIEEFKSTWFKDGKAPDHPNQAMMRDLMKIQREAVDAGAETDDLDTLQDELFGPSDKKQLDDKPKRENTQHQDRDVLNRAQRELETTQNLASHLKQEVSDLEEEKKKLETEIKAYQRVAENLYVQVEEIQREGDEARTDEARRIARKAASTILAIQRESHDVITSLEARLENAIRIGDTALDSAIILRRIADSLYTNQIKRLDADPTAFKSTRTKQAAVESSPRKLTEDQKKNRQSATGNRSGWY